MNNQTSYIPSGGVGEIYLNLIDMYWYAFESSTFIEDKEIPFIKLVYDVATIHMRYYRNQTILERSEDMPKIIIKIGKTSAKLIRSFNRIKRLSDDLFCTGDIQTIDYCLEVYRQFLSNEEFDPFLWNAWEIKTTLIRLQPELENFVRKTEIFFRQIMKLLKLNSYFKTNSSDNIYGKFKKAIS